MGLSYQTSTTTWPPVPKGLYNAYNRDYCSDLNDKRTKSRHTVTVVCQRPENKRCIAHKCVIY